MKLVRMTKIWYQGRRGSTQNVTGGDAFHIVPWEWDPETHEKNHENQPECLTLQFHIVEWIPGNILKDNTSLHF
jgi:hypothetical protein